MIIALDFDGTYTEDPSLWDLFLAGAKNNGHTVICCTMRHEDEGIVVQYHLQDKVSAIYYTNRMNKMQFLGNLGIIPDVWIDDEPHWIFRDAANPVPTLEEPSA